MLSHWPDINENDISAVTNQLLSGELSSAGKIEVVNSLEDKFKCLTGCKYSIAMSSGTVALYSALFALGISPKDEVIVPVYTYHAVAAPLIAMNVTPIFVDIDEVFGHINSEKIEQSITNRTKAIIVVHSYGYPINMEPILNIAKKHCFRVIEDCSHAHGSEFKGKSVGGIGDVGFFSLQASKLVPAGEGGILVTDSQEIYEKALLLGHHFARTSLDIKSQHLRKFIQTGLGLKFRINPLGAALANSQFERLPEFIQEKQEMYRYISDRLSTLPEIEPIFPEDYMTISTFYSYRFKYKSWKDKKFDQFLMELKKKNICISKPSGMLLNKENIFNEEGFDFGLIHKNCQDSANRNVQFDGANNYVNSIFRIPSFYSSKANLDEFLDQICSIYYQVHQ
ncbi:hypothetical protein DOK67_0000678 [Enterococcus sp. DIV0212c]